MEKRTLLAVILSMGVMMIFLMIQDSLNPRQPAVPPGEQPHDIPGQVQGPVFHEGVAPVAPPPIMVEGEEADAEPPVAELVPLQEVIIVTERKRVVLSNAWGNITSFQLLNHFDRGRPVEMILAGNAPAQAFTVAFGNLEDVMAGRLSPEQRNFRVRRITDLIVEFSQDFSTLDGGQFTMTKRYEFQPNEYMFQLSIILDGGQSVNSFNFGGAAYTLVFGPQIGPSFTRLDGRHDFRRFIVHRDGRLRDERVTERAPAVITSLPRWAAIVGQYFTLVTIPLSRTYDIGFSVRGEGGLSDASRVYISSPAFTGFRLDESFLFYFGPKNHQNLIIYERGDNAFGQSDTGIARLAASRGFLAPLETGLKWLLTFFYTRTVPNYGVAIIFLTIFVKLITFPLTKKASEGTMRMQALAPKIKEIQEKNKGNPQKMNAEMGEFYRREGYNPLSGCLPMLVQLPIFIAMFQLFNTHFDLRGAVFIPGWIDDLSVPEYVLMSETFRLPLLGWYALRILPFIYVASQLLYGKVIQTPAQMGNPMMMKMMLYFMPVIFFFILYDMPSGLLVYWIMSNVLTMVQQKSINKYMARKKAIADAAAAAAAPVTPRPVIAPPGGAKKKKRK